MPVFVNSDIAIEIKYKEYYKTEIYNTLKESMNSRYIYSELEKSKIIAGKERYSWKIQNIIDGLEKAVREPSGADTELKDARKTYTRFIRRLMAFEWLKKFIEDVSCILPQSFDDKISYSEYLDKLIKFIRRYFDKRYRYDEYERVSVSSAIDCLKSLLRYNDYVTVDEYCERTLKAIGDCRIFKSSPVSGSMRYREGGK